MENSEEDLFSYRKSRVELSLHHVQMKFSSRRWKKQQKSSYANLEISCQKKPGSLLIFAYVSINLVYFDISEHEKWNVLYLVHRKIPKI